MCLFLLDAKLGEPRRGSRGLTSSSRASSLIRIFFIDKNCLKKDRATTYSVFQAHVSPPDRYSALLQFSRFILIHIFRLYLLLPKPCVGIGGFRVLRGFRPWCRLRSPPVPQLFRRADLRTQYQS